MVEVPSSNLGSPTKLVSRLFSFGMIGFNAEKELSSINCESNLDASAAWAPVGD